MRTPEKRMQNYLKYFGWQGGTIHQIAKETGCSVNDLLYGESKQVSICSDNSKGYFALNTCGLDHRINIILPKMKGNIDFWLGVGNLA